MVLLALHSHPLGSLERYGRESCRLAHTGCLGSRSARSADAAGPFLPPAGRLVHTAADRPWPGHTSPESTPTCTPPAHPVFCGGWSEAHGCLATLIRQVSMRTDEAIRHEWSARSSGWRSWPRTVSPTGPWVRGRAMTRVGCIARTCLDIRTESRGGTCVLAAPGRGPLACSTAGREGRGKLRPQGSWSADERCALRSV